MARRFSFTVPLVNYRGGGGSRYVLEIPEHVSSAIGRRGPVPIVATLNKDVEIQASLVPTGGGRHRLQLNTRTRRELGIEPGDAVRVVLSVPKRAQVLPLPAEFAEALREADLVASFAGLPAGKQNHIISWIAEAVRPETREKRIAMAIQVAYRARERAAEREG